jgi:hypothetical protein
MTMAGRATARWGVLLLIVGLPIASAGALTLTDGTLTAGKATPPTCASGAQTVTQNLGTGGNATNVVSVDVSGIASACGGGTLKVSIFNGTDAVQEATKIVPAGGGTVTVTLGTAVPLKESHFASVSLQGP